MTLALGVTHVLDLFGFLLSFHWWWNRRNDCPNIVLRRSGGDIEDSGDVAVGPVKSRDNLSGDRRDISSLYKDGDGHRLLCNWFHSVDKNDWFRGSLGGNYIRGNGQPL